MGGQAVDQKINSSHSGTRRKKTIKLLSLNTCGLKSKLFIPEFNSFISNYDIIGFQETKTDSLDILSIPNYKLVCKHRKHIAKKKSGGIAVAYKGHLDRYTTFLESSSKLVLWFKLADSLTKCGTVLCGVVYIPPENSEYAVENPFGEIEEELHWFSSSCTSVLLLGDFNSRTRQLQDFVLPDRELFRLNDMSDLYDELRPDILYFEENSLYVTLHRQNPDSGINNYGYRLTDFCRDNGIYILNGRTNRNSNICNTCKNLSTVDYFLVSPEMFQHVDSLIVSDFCGLLSDAHNPVSLTLTISHTIQTARSDTYTERIRLWDSENSKNFLAHLDENKLGSILNNIIDLENRQTILQKDIDYIAESLSATFKSTAVNSFGMIRENTNSNCNKPPHWFNRKCKRARKKFHRAKFLYKLRPSDTNKLNLKFSSKEYKKTLFTEQKLYKMSKIKQICQMKKSHPRKFWKFFNRNKKSSADVTVENCFEYFRSMNSSGDDEHIPETNFDILCRKFRN